MCFDSAQIKTTFGDRLLLHGGINAVLWDDLEQIEAEMRRKKRSLRFLMIQSCYKVGADVRGSFSWCLHRTDRLKP